MLYHRSSLQNTIHIRRAVAQESGKLKPIAILHASNKFMIEFHQTQLGTAHFPLKR